LLVGNDAGVCFGLEDIIMPRLIIDFYELGILAFVEDAKTQTRSTGRERKRSRQAIEVLTAWGYT